MPKNAIKKYGWYMLIFGLATVVGLGLAPTSKKIFAADDESGFLVKNYGKYTKIEKLVVDYHTALNKYLNERIESYTKASEKERAKMDASPTKDGEFDTEGCGKIEKATSTFCVSRVFLKEYFRFRQQMLMIRNNSTAFNNAQEKIAELKKDQKLSFNESQQQYGEITGKVQKMDKIIDDELGYAERTMELALAAYNEFHMAYPLHKKLHKFIFELENFRDALAGIRDEVEILPFTFFNVQTPSCT